MDLTIIEEQVIELMDEFGFSCNVFNIDDDKQFMTEFYIIDLNSAPVAALIT